MESNKKEPRGDEALTKRFFSKTIFWLWINSMSLITLWGTDSEWVHYFFDAIFLLSAAIIVRGLSRQV